MNLLKKVGLGLVLAAAVVPAAAQAQVRVQVNGEMVNFPAAQPQMMNGRILVPLRGVMEKLGAFVSWQPATETVIAQAGPREIQIKIGADFATVNGTQVYLDQPALILRGTTMVPLRFMGEALGADVKWDGASSTVMITTGSGGTTTGGGTTGGGGATTGGGTTGSTTGGTTGGATDIAITNFSIKANPWVRANETIEVTLVGTAGGQATFSIPGLVEQSPMTEQSAGRYVGSFKVPAAGNAITLTETSVIGSLKIGNRERLIQGGSSINVDNMAPTISAKTPEDGTRHEGLRPSISAVFSDGAGSGIDPASVKLVLNNVDITKQATITENFIVFQSTGDYNAATLHRVGLTVRDRAGNVSTSVWTFNVGAQASVVKSFTHDGNRRLEPGDVINFTVMADRGGTAVVKFQKTEREVRLTENPAGTYKGEYVVRRDDAFAGDTVLLAFDPAGAPAAVTIQAADKVGLATSNPVVTQTAPTIASPKDGATVRGSMVVEGTAIGSKSVQVRVMYKTTVLGGFPLTGVLQQLEVDTDEKGNFKTESISLSFRLKGSNTEYTIEVTGVSADGKTTETKTITVSEN